MEQTNRSQRKLHREKLLNIPPLLEYETFPVLVVNFYHQYKRDLPWRKSLNPYHIWISEIMLQQTRVDTVIPYYHRFLTAFPTIDDLALADEEKLHKIWEGLGYYRRVANMKKAAQVLIEKWNGKMPSTYEELLTLPGIGPYTASAIASIAFGEVVPAMDGNIIRIMSRILGENGIITKKATQEFLREETYLRMDKKDPGSFNQGLMDLGARICIPNGTPLCNHCPISSYCYAFMIGNPTAYPIKPQKRKRNIEKRTILIIKKPGKVALQKRPNTGLLAGLWEFPSLLGHLEEEDVFRYLEEKGIPIKGLRPLPASRHVFSHLEWDMIGYMIESKDLAFVGEKHFYTWVKEEELITTYALPTAYEAYKTVIFQERKDNKEYGTP